MAMVEVVILLEIVLWKLLESPGCYGLHVLRSDILTDVTVCTPTATVIFDIIFRNTMCSFRVVGVCVCVRACLCV